MFEPIKFIIIHDDTKITHTAAEQLSAYISSDDRLECSVWDEKTYGNNKTQLSSSQPLIFIGDVKEAKMLSPVIEWKSAIVNMKYGWRGKKALLTVDKKSLSENEVKELKERLQQFYDETNGEKFKMSFGVVSSYLLNPFIATALGCAGGGFVSLSLGVATAAKAMKLFSAEYACLAYSFFKDGLQDFSGLTVDEKGKE